MSAEISQTVTTTDQSLSSQHSSATTTEFSSTTAASVNSVERVCASQASVSQLASSCIRLANSNLCYVHVLFPNEHHHCSSISYRK